MFLGIKDEPETVAVGMQKRMFCARKSRRVPKEDTRCGTLFKHFKDSHKGCGLAECSHTDTEGAVAEQTLYLGSSRSQGVRVHPQLHRVPTTEIPSKATVTALAESLSKLNCRKKQEKGATKQRRRCRKPPCKTGGGLQLSH